MCSSLSGDGGAFPPEAAVIQPAVVFRDIVFREEECDIAVTDMRIAMIPPVTNRHIEQMNSGSVDGDAYNGRLCLQYPDNVDDFRDGYVNSQGLNHWHTVTWNRVSRILGSFTTHYNRTVCYDCLCLMALFRTVMSLARDWVEVFVWTGHDEGSCCRSTGWELRYLPRIYPPCVVNRLGGYLTEIKVPGLGLVLSEDRNNSTRRCVCMRRTPLGVFSAGRISLTLIGCRASDWVTHLLCFVCLPGCVLYCWIRFILDILWYGLCLARWMSVVPQES